MTKQIPNQITSDYNRNAIFDTDGPIDPTCVEQAICTIIRTTPIDPDEPQSHTSRRMVCAVRALAALHPRDEIEIMLGVQAVCAYNAATDCWRLGANPRLADGDKTRHVSKAATAVRTFDSLLRALERRQAKPLSVPIGRPAAQTWPNDDMEAVARDMRRRCGIGEAQRGKGPTLEETKSMSDDEMVCAWARSGHTFFEDENQGLDIANTEGILPGGGMIMPEEPTPQQEEYLERRLLLKYLREKAENDRNGIDKKIVFSGLRPGDLVP